jgi:hypothetical protein
MTLIKNILPKMEKCDEKIMHSIASYEAFLKKHIFSHGDKLS